MIYNSPNSTYIDGTYGAYDGKIKNSAVRYGRNAINDTKRYLQETTIKPSSPLDSFQKMTKEEQLEAFLSDDFQKAIQDVQDEPIRANWEEFKQDIIKPLEYRYSKDGKVDPMSLLGASYEEMDENTSLSKEELVNKCVENLSGGRDFEDKVIDIEQAVSLLDLNEDGQIDLAEYSAGTLIQDEKSSAFGFPTGRIDDEGMQEAFELAKQKPELYADKLRFYYNRYKLGANQFRFTNTPNNLISRYQYA